MSSEIQGLGIVLDYNMYRLYFELRKAVKDGKNGLCIIGNMATSYENALKIISKEIKNVRRTS